MSAPAERNKSLRYLQRDFLSRKESRPFLSAASNELTANLAAPATIAHWILAYHPELASRNSLRIAVLGVEEQDSADDGCWYALLPWLLGNEEMTVETVLVGPEVGKATHPLLAQLPRTRAGTIRTSAGKVNHSLPPAKLARTRAGAFLDSKLGKELYDLFFLFNPGLEMLHEENSWLSPGELDAVCRRGVPIGVASFCAVEYHTEQWLLDAHGLTNIGRPARANPFKGQDSPAGAWGSTLWELKVESQTAESVADLERLELFEYYNETLSNFCEDGFPISDEIGQPREDLRDATTNLAIGSAVLLLDSSTAVSLNSGVVHIVGNAPRFPWMEGMVANEDSIVEYPIDDPYNFEHIRWAVELVGELADEAEDFDTEDEGGAPGLADVMQLAADMAHLRKSLAEPGSEEAEDGRLFPFSKEEMDEHMRSFFKMATGEDIDPDHFMESMRVQGGMHGPTHPAWHDLLHTIGWNIESYLDEPKRFQPAFYTTSAREGKRYPVVCENYAYIPGDDSDNLVTEAKAVLGRNHPEGVLLMFKAMMFKEVGGKRYSFGGMLYQDNQWRPFALNERMSNVDDVLSQREEGFSFNSPKPQYADEGGSLAVGLNCMTHGADPNSPQKIMLLKQGDWMSPMPG